MTRFTIIIRKSNADGWLVPVTSDSFIAQKMSKMWVKNAYGENSTEYRDNHEFYFVNRKNRFGVIWVTKIPNKSNYNICVTGNGENIPFDTDYIVCKHV